MRTLLWRELVVIGRRPAVPLGCLTIAAALTTFVVLWPHGIALGSWNVYRQTRLLAIGLCALVLPWVAARSASPERGDSLTMLAAHIVSSPAAIVLARALAHALTLTLVSTSAVPALLLARQAAALPWPGVAADGVTLAAIAMLAAAIATTGALAIGDRLMSWIVTTGVNVLCLVLMSRAAPGIRSIAIATALVGIVTIAAAGVWSRTACLYLRDAHA